MENYKLETGHIIIGVVILTIGWMLWTQCANKKEPFSPVPFWKPRQFSKYDPFYVYGKAYDGEPAYISTYNPLWGNVDEIHTAVPMATKIDPSDYRHQVKLVEPPKDEPSVLSMDKPVMVQPKKMPVYENVREDVGELTTWAQNITGKQICVSVGLLIIIGLIVWYFVRQNNMKKLMSPFETMSEKLKELFKRKEVVPGTTTAKTIGLTAFGF